MLLALACMLVRAVLPMPAEAHARAGLSPELRLLGAALCHDGDAPGDSAPNHALACDHCPVCSVAPHMPIGPLAAIMHPPLPASTLLMRPMVGNSLAPRAPPGQAHPPRAPPIL